MARLLLYRTVISSMIKLTRIILKTIHTEWHESGELRAAGDYKVGRSMVYGNVLRQRFAFGN